MGYQRNMLLRTSLSDVGDMSGHGSYCSSPDMIIHSLVNDPQTYYKNNYKNDPNQKLDRSSQTNTIYTRAKSMQDKAGEITGYIRMYRANASLFMNSDQWKNNKLLTPKGKEYTKVTAQKNGDIVVGDDVLVVDGTKPNFCMVGIINDSTAETVPDKFKSYNSFINWVHSERCVAVRNFSLYDSGVSNDYESLYSISNPESISRRGLIIITVTGVPKGTVIGVENDDLFVSETMTFDPANPRPLLEGVQIPVNYDGYVRIYARLPQGAVWPPKAKITTELLIEALESEEMMQFALRTDKLFLERNILEDYKKIDATGYLVKVGECEALFTE